MNKYRHEIKYIVSKSEAKILQKKLSLLMTPDANGKSGSYNIKSLYFDDLNNTSYHEKLDGVLYREKYRIRIYDNSEEFIRLEKKVKNNDLCLKKQTLITKDIYSKIVNDEMLISDTEDEVLREFLIKKRLRNLIPSVLVSYDRVAFTYHLSNVRITFDSNIRSGKYSYNLFDDNAFYKTSDSDEIVMEVKYDDFLPDSINVLLSSISSYRLAVSKFARCRNIK